MALGLQNSERVRLRSLDTREGAEHPHVAHACSRHLQADPQADVNGGPGRVRHDEVRHTARDVVRMNGDLEHPRAQILL